MFRPFFPLLALSLALVACGAQEPTDPFISELPKGLREGSPEALGVLALLGDAKTTLAVLDDDVGLDKRAAANLIAHRDGPDGKRGTADDNAFDTIAEVDAIKWVGESAINALLAYAEAKGFVQRPPDDQSGTFDGVPFTAVQAKATLALANTAAQTLLDDDVQLDARAARNIVAARPIADMKALASISYVGATALRLLRDYIDLHSGPQDCTPTQPCPAGMGLRCQGLPNDGSQKVGKCIDVSHRMPGEGEPCDVNAPCGAHLVCAGLANWGAGDCVPDWMAAEFFDEGVSSIPDNNANGGSAQVLVYGLASVPVDVVVKIDIAHARRGDLQVTLTDPNGQTVLIWQDASDDKADLRLQTVVRGISGDDQVNGTWRLGVVDTRAGVSGTLRFFSLSLTSRWD